VLSSIKHRLRDSSFVQHINSVRGSSSYRPQTTASITRFTTAFLLYRSVRVVVHTHLLDAPIQECEALETDGTDAATVAGARALEQRLGVTFTVGRRDRAQVAPTVGCDRELLGI
jgi:hypothetical protein